MVLSEAMRHMVLRLVCVRARWRTLGVLRCVSNAVRDYVNSSALAAERRDGDWEEEIVFYTGGGLTSQAAVGHYAPRPRMVALVDGQWHELAEIPLALGLHTIATCDGRIVNTGGVIDNSYSRVTWVYEPTTNQWVSHSEVPGYFQNCRACSEIEGDEPRILCMGEESDESRSERGVTDWNIIAAAFAPASNAWTRLPQMPQSVFASSSVALDRRLFFVVGGITSGPPSRMLDAFQLFDVRANTWSLLKNLPVPLAFAAVAIVARRLYVIGGRTYGTDQPNTQGTALNSLFVFDLDAMDWTTADWTTGPSMPDSGPVGRCAAIVRGTDVVIVSLSAHTYPAKLDTILNSWSLLPDDDPLLQCNFANVLPVCSKR